MYCKDWRRRLTAWLDKGWSNDGPQYGWLHRRAGFHSNREDAYVIVGAVLFVAVLTTLLVLLGRP